MYLIEIHQSKMIFHRFEHNEQQLAVVVLLCLPENIIHRFIQKHSNNLTDLLRQIVA